MNQVAELPGSPWLDDNRRLAWIAPIAIILWLGLLGVFASLLTRTAPPPPEVTTVEAQIVELPAPGGLQSSAPAAPKPNPQPVVVHRTVPHVIPHHVKRHPVAPPPLPPSEEGTAKTEPEAAPSAAAATSSGSSTSSSGSTSSAGGTGSGSGNGIVGNDNSGARAIYAPVPEIPDDLREQAMVAVAVAHFAVGYDGQVAVTLTQPTMNPELNALLIDTLKQWKFAPATKNGVSIASEFDIRIPVTVQ